MKSRWKDLKGRSKEAFDVRELRKGGNWTLSRGESQGRGYTLSILVHSLWNSNIS